MQCLAKEPAQRPASARDVAGRISSGAAPFTGVAAVPAPEPPGKFRWGLWLGLGSALIMLLVGAAWLLRSHRAAQAQAIPGKAAVPGRHDETAFAGQRRTNTLGMVFVSMPETKAWFSIWDTRVQDYRAFVDATKRTWEKPAFEQEQTHPAVNVSWEDAKAFCQWLSHKEGQSYRLPTDEEWSQAAGLSHESGDTPKDKDGKITDVYPWGGQWPPRRGAGNYADQAAKEKYSGWLAVSAFNDGYAQTSPVGMFETNGLGLYDMGGNVWQWCEDSYYPGTQSRVLRGGSCLNHSPSCLQSSARAYNEPGFRGDAYGFRCVWEPRR
jgi:hypothetical protein